MELDKLLQIPQFSLKNSEKEKLLLECLQRLTLHHKKHSKAFAKIVRILFPSEEWSYLHELPYIPVGLFKKHDLMSIPKEQVFKTLTSSGTTSSIPSKIFLDRETAIRQSAALVKIMTVFLGKKRLPMLIIDTPTVIQNRKSFSARGAGILGMMYFGRDHLYILDDNMVLNKESLKKWLQKHKGSPILLFGFTFMVWKYFIKMIHLLEVDIPDGILIHSGGWKKLQEEAISTDEFRKELQNATGITRCHNFYGMVEQVGSVFMECEEGFLHTPNFAEVIIRNPKTWNEAGLGESGVVQTLSILPTCYPGHSLLTEDLGKVHGIDTCRCGRNGKFFSIEGRVPKSELRGCSDTHAYS